MRRSRVRIGTAIVAVVGAVAVWLVATRLFPYHSLNHDEGVYLQQAAMLLEGQLSIRPPVEGVFRPWFFVDAGERLYAKYSPVPPAMFAVGGLLGSYRLALVGIAAGNLALVVGVVREAFDRRSALVAAAFVLASPLFLLDSAVFLPYAPTTLLNLVFAYGYLRADRTGDRRWAAVAGVGVALAFFSRPYTAVLFATPFIVHALWTLYRAPREALGRQAIVAALGLAGVAAALAYNAAMTGSAFLFPYEAFAPLDGLGFGQRRILNHEIEYTPELALRANARVVWALFSEWVAGGLLGTAAAVAGLAVAVRRGIDPRQAAVAGVFASVTVGNVYFWGNYNVLGDLEAAGDGLISALGPYYHFDLLVPTAAFAAVAAVAGFDALRGAVERRVERSDRDRLAGITLDPHATRAVLVAAVLLTAGVTGAVTVDNNTHTVERNAAVTDTYETAYEPFEGGPPANSLVYLPDPYGDWLNHPFQALRNDPGFDGRAVYALGERPFETADAFPERELYRYTYRGPWSPLSGSPDAARLQPVADVSGERVALNATVGVPDGADTVTVRVGTDDDSAYYAASGTDGELPLRLTVEDGRAALTGLDRRSGEPLSVTGRETVRLSAFVDYGPGGSFTYRLDVPVEVSDGEARALSPRVELCRGARSCGGAATYVPETAPDGVFVRTDLSASERNP